MILENGWLKFICMCARALSRYCWFRNIASILLTAVWGADFCSSLSEAVKQGLEELCCSAVLVCKASL